MRISQDEIQLLKSKLYELSHSAKIYLFGSRVDDSKKGGDIDLLVLDDELKNKDLRKLRIAFFKEFGEQKLDIVLDKFSMNNIFTKNIINKAIEL
ncbi:MAG: nucleotidyltransferase domain-containing protein [Arcobacter sp.]|uniref:nucleotidyltransferase domain-containing protein n=1 Tax=Arcobacter sp. TaxID=1872629 RepID=UPI003C757BC0